MQGPRRPGSGTHAIDPDERRRLTRVPVSLPAAVELEDGRSFPVHITDLGIGGVFVESGMAPPYDAEVDLTLYLADGRGLVRIPAVVRWVTETGFGLQFGRLEAETACAMLRVVGSGGSP